jgi:hypothetical protein
LPTTNSIDCGGETKVATAAVVRRRHVPPFMAMRTNFPRVPLILFEQSGGAQSAKAREHCRKLRQIGNEEGQNRVDA